MAIAGSPGIMWIMPKVIRLTISMIGRALPSRRTKTRPIVAAYLGVIHTFAIRGMRKGANPPTLARTPCTLVNEPNGIE